LKLAMTFLIIGIASFILALTFLVSTITFHIPYLSYLNWILFPLSGICIVVGIVLFIIKR